MVNTWNKSLFLLYCLPGGCGWHGFAGCADPSLKSYPPWLHSPLLYPYPMGFHPCNLALGQPGPPCPACAAEPFSSMPEGRASQRKWTSVGSALSWSCEWLFGSRAAPGINTDLRHMTVRWAPSSPRPPRPHSLRRSIPVNRAFDDPLSHPMPAPLYSSCPGGTAMGPLPVPVCGTAWSRRCGGSYGGPQGAGVAQGVWMTSTADGIP